MPTTCPFCRILAGQAEAHRVLETAEVVAFLDARPVFKGHTLVIPRDHHVTLGDLPADLLPPFFAAVQRVSTVIPPALGVDGTFVAMNNVVSQSVPHLHAHVVPRVQKDGLRGFFWPRQKYEDGEAARYAQAIARALTTDSAEGRQR